MYLLTHSLLSFLPFLGYDEFWVLEVHYNNPEGKAGLHDATGMEVRVCLSVYIYIYIHIYIYIYMCVCVWVGGCLGVSARREIRPARTPPAWRCEYVCMCVCVCVSVSVSVSVYIYILVCVGVAGCINPEGKAGLHDATGMEVGGCLCVGVGVWVCGCVGVCFYLCTPHATPPLPLTTSHPKKPNNPIPSPKHITRLHPKTNTQITYSPVLRTRDVGVITLGASPDVASMSFTSPLNIPPGA